MAEYALGWLGWSEQQALAADVNAIIIGFEGRVAMLKYVFGSSEAPADEQEQVSGRTLTPELFEALF